MKLLNYPNPREILSEMIKQSFGIERYVYIVKELQKRNVSKDKDYQRTYNAFYVVRRDAKWRKIYFDYFEKHKNNKKLSFEEVIHYLYKQTGFVESSFSSKLLSTINPQMPIWDLYVLKNLGLETKVGKPLYKLEQSVKLYTEINDYYLGLSESKWGKDAISTFNIALPQYKWISDIKKIDFFIWKVR
jgi:hypothetical protein